MNKKLSGSISLHPEKGVNPHMTYCPQCGGDGDDIILLGKIDKTYQCLYCETIHIGRPERGVCKSCGKYNDFLTKEIKDTDRFPSSTPCKECTERNAKVDEVVKEGGVFWRCKDCKSAGGIRKESELAIQVRLQNNVKAPNPIGIEFTKDDCPVCGTNAVADPKEKP